MSDTDFQNGLIVGLSLKGLTKSNIPVEFLNYFIFKFYTDTFMPQTLELSEDALTVSLAVLGALSTDMQVPIASGLSDSFSASLALDSNSLSITTRTFSDAASYELT
ncbi:MAG: hypothetical protein ACQ5SW_08415 [Sphaerochaetaceae bacterium]